MQQKPHSKPSTHASRNRICGGIALAAFFFFAVLGMRMNLSRMEDTMPGCTNASLPLLVVCPHYALQHVQDWQHLLHVLPAAGIQLLGLFVLVLLAAPVFVLIVQQTRHHWLLRQRLRSILAATVRYCIRTQQFATGVVAPKLYA